MMKLAALAFAIMLLGALSHADVIAPNTHAIEKCVKITGLDAYPGFVFLGVVSPISSPQAPPTLVQIFNGECIDAGSHYKFDRFLLYYADKSHFDRVGISGIKTGNVTISGICPWDSGQGGSGALQQQAPLPPGMDATCVAMQTITDPAFSQVYVDGSFSAPYAPYYVSDSDDSKSVTIEYGVYEMGRGGGLAVRKVSEEKSRYVHRQENPYPARPGDSPPAPPGGDSQPDPPGEMPPSPQPAATNVFQSFICWLFGLFGMKC
jgi:hypothetical protein